jgi:uncharacterized membrane protein YkvA (DUF1232 family)
MMHRVRAALARDPEQITAILDQFPAKLAKSAGRIRFSEQVVAVYYAVRDPRTSMKVKATLAAALLYFIVPTDAIPDFVAGLGFTDDFTVLTLALRKAGSALRDEHYESARRLLKRGQESA